MTEVSRRQPIGVYEYLNYDDSGQVLRPWDPRALEVAKRVAELIRSRMPDVQVEHVGSSAIPGCAGKGIIDLLVMYPPGRLAAARDALDGLGFQRQGGVDPFPEERPLRLGAYDYDGETFRLHAHVVAADDPEGRELIFFRDHLREHPDLVDEYVAAKRASIEALQSSPSDLAPNIAYNAGKQPVIRRILDRMDVAREKA